MPGEQPQDAGNIDGEAAVTVSEPEPQPLDQVDLLKQAIEVNKNSFLAKYVEKGLQYDQAVKEKTDECQGFLNMMKDALTQHQNFQNTLDKSINSMLQTENTKMQ